MSILVALSRSSSFAIDISFHISFRLLSKSLHCQNWLTPSLCNTLLFHKGKIKMSFVFVHSGFNTKASRLRSWVSLCNQVFNLSEKIGLHRAIDRCTSMVINLLVDDSAKLAEKQNQSKTNHKWLWSWTMHISKDTRLRGWVSPCNQVINLSEKIGLHRTIWYCWMHFQGDWSLGGWFSKTGGKAKPKHRLHCFLQLHLPLDTNRKPVNSMMVYDDTEFEGFVLRKKWK